MLEKVYCFIYVCVLHGRFSKVNCLRKGTGFNFHYTLVVCTKNVFFFCYQDNVAWFWLIYCTFQWHEHSELQKQENDCFFLLPSILIMLTTNLPWKTKLIQIHQFDLLNLLNFNLAMLYFLKFLVIIEDECQLWKIQLLPLLGLELETSLYATEWRSNCKTSDIWPPRTWIFEKCISWSLKSLMNPFTPTGGQSKNWKKNHSFLFFFSNPAKQIAPCNITVNSKRFHLNGYTMGFCPQTQKLELHYMSP